MAETNPTRGSSDSFLSIFSQKTPLIQVTKIVHSDDNVESENTTNTEKRHVQIPTIGIDNPVFDDDENKLTEEDLIVPMGGQNLFNAEFEDIHTPLPTPMPIKRGSNPNVFVFDPECESLYSRRGSYSFDVVTPRPQKFPRRGSTALTGSDKSSLNVPTMKQLRSSDQSNGLKPYQDSASDSHIPPPSPGVLSTNSAWSELIKIKSSRRSSDAGLSDFSRISNVSSSLSEHLRYLIRAFSSRTEKVKESTLQPPSPSSLSDYAGSDVLSAISAEPQFRHRLDSFLPEQPEGDTISEIVRIREEELSQHKKKFRIPRWLYRLRFPHVIEPQSKLYLIWLFIVTLAFMYNAWVIPLRTSFPYQTSSNLKYWLIADYLCDFVYIVDILLFKMRITFLNSGLKETHRKATRANYMKKKMFRFDCLSLLPLDFLYLIDMKVNPWYRLPRLLKIQTFWEFHSRCDHLVRSAHAVRIVKTMTYMLFLIHIETCGYYAVSVYEGLNSNPWVYNGVGNAYIRCFYLATKTATSIGNNPKPQNQLEYMFMTVYWMSGVFVFALLIGQIRDIVDAANMVKTLYTQRMDAVLNYGKNMNVPKDTQDRVRTWFIYNWQQQKIIDERNLMDTLPMKLRKDLAIHVHFNTLSKVKLFQDCDKTLLYDLVLKLRPILYLPGDYVCKKGEIGKEMYIVSQGVVEVVGGPNNTLVLATLREGSVFGEISLLAMATEGNRRTADVRCKGFTNLFTLSKNDFEAAMKDYPDAHKLLKKRAKKLLRLNARIERKSQCSIDHNKVKAINIIKTPPETPKMVRTVIQVMDPDSAVIRHINGFDKDSLSSTDSKEKIPKDNVIGGDNQAYEPGSEYNISGKVPTPQEVEDFFDEILTVHDWSDVKPESVKDMEDSALNTEREDENDDDAQDKGSQKKKTSNSSTSSTDSGVQDTKTASPASSTPRTVSNKDSKESFVSTELGDILEGSEYSEDDDTQPTFDGINYTADMFGDIESQKDKDKYSDALEDVHPLRYISKNDGCKTEYLSFEGNEYAKAFVHGFKITVESVDEMQPASQLKQTVVNTEEEDKQTETVQSNKHISFTGIQNSQTETHDTFDTCSKKQGPKNIPNKPVSRTLTKTQKEELQARPKGRVSAHTKPSAKPCHPDNSPYVKSSTLNKARANAAALKPMSKQQKHKPVGKGTTRKPSEHDNTGLRANDGIVDRSSKTCESASEKTRTPERNNQTESNPIVEQGQNVRSISVTEARDCDSVDNITTSPIPAENQVTCFAEVHREKTLSPISKRKETLSPATNESQSQRQRKISVISIGTVLQDGRETLV